MPAANVVPLPPEVSDEIASFLDPLGNAVHTALSFDLIGEDVLITGAGPIGCMAAAIAKHVGARHVIVTDMNEFRLKIARQMGATHAVNVKEQKLSAVMEELRMKEGFDVGLEMSGSPHALKDMVEVMNHGGKIALLGILPDPTPLAMTKVIFKSLTLKGIYGREMFETWYKMISMLQSGLNVSPVITHRFVADDFEKAFDVMLKGEAGKVILDWS
jgi:threonine 3-dehydrogenase